MFNMKYNFLNWNGKMMKIFLSGFFSFGGLLVKAQYVTVEQKIEALIKKMTLELFAAEKKFLPGYK